MNPESYPVELVYRLSKLAIAMNKRKVKIYTYDKTFLFKVMDRYDLYDKQKTIEEMREI